MDTQSKEDVSVFSSLLFNRSCPDAREMKAVALDLKRLRSEKIQNKNRPLVLHRYQPGGGESVQTHSSLRAPAAADAR